MLWTRPGIAALVALGLSACGSDYDNCPPAGTYVTMATRSADPGDCPLDVEIVTFDPVLTLGTKRNCHPESGPFGYDIDDGTHTCSVRGTLMIFPSHSDIHATLSVRTDCWGDYSTTCTANYDIDYTPESGP